MFKLLLHRVAVAGHLAVSGINQGSLIQAGGHSTFAHNTNLPTPDDGGDMLGKAPQLGQALHQCSISEAGGVSILDIRNESDRAM